MTKLTHSLDRVVTTRDGDVLVIRLDVDGVYVRAAKTRTWYGPFGYGRLLLACAEASIAKPSITKAQRTKRGGRVSRGLLSLTG